MAHEISIINGVAEMAYLLSEGACWHGLGQSVGENASIEEWNTACNISNWIIEKQKALMMINGSLHRVPNTLHLTRSDNNKVLATVSDQFKVHQPQEISNWMFDLVNELGFEMSTMGVLFDGKVFWAQVNVKQSANVGGVDMINRKLLIRVPNTGKDATTITDTNVRVVCNNTMRTALQSGKSMLKLSHLNEFKADQVSDMLGLTDLAEWQRTAENMTRVKLTETAYYDYALKVFKLYEETETESDDILEQQAERMAIAGDNRAVQSCYELFSGAGMGAELVTAKGTLWGAVNSVTEYVDHKRNTRTWDSRFDSANFGQWANVKDRAWDEAMLLL